MAWMELENIMLSEISQSVIINYHMISPRSRANKQNRTTDMETLNRLKVTRGERKGDNGGKKGEGNRQITCLNDPWT